VTNKCIIGVDSAIDEFNHHSGKALIIINYKNMSARCEIYTTEKPFTSEDELCVYVKGFLPGSDDLKITHEELDYYVNM